MLHYFLFYKILTTFNEVSPSAYKAQQFLSSTRYLVQVLNYLLMLSNVISNAN